MSEGDPSFWQRLAESHPALPFVGLAVAKAGQHVDRPLYTRIIEGVIMGTVGGAIGAGAVMYVALKVLENDVRWIGDSIDRVEHRLDRLESYHWERRDP